MKTPMEAMRYYRELPSRRRVQLQLYVEANAAERNRGVRPLLLVVITVAMVAAGYWVVK